MVFEYFKKKGYSVYGTTRKELDPLIMNESEIENILKSYKPNVIINCIGIINKYANKDIETTYKINSELPHLLAYLGIKNKFKIIHISSDCAIDNDTYGKSKKLGEFNDSYNLTIRTSIIGPELKNGYGLFNWFMHQENKVYGFKNALWDGVTTLELSKFIEKAIKSNLTKLINYRTKENINKFDLLKLISKIYNKNINILPDYRPMKDKRELNSEFWCNKSYEKQLIEMKEF